MKINASEYSIKEILQMLERRELLVNKDYQRGTGLWPDGPASYFIETILEGFPFPKIYLYEFLTRPERELRKEIVDGQQRIAAMRRFFDNELRLTSDSKYQGQTFNDLDDDEKDAFLTYTVSADVIRNANTAEILQMFRRMNAYTLPLNQAEKRHSTYQGAFKWSINSLAAELEEFFVEFGVFQTREIVRMADAEFISEIILAMKDGVISTSPSDLSNLYRDNDEAFPESDRYHNEIVSAVQYVTEHFGDLRRTKMMKNYAAQSLIIALIHCRYGIPKIAEEWGVASLGRFTTDAKVAATNLLALAQAHEAKEIDGPYEKYVWGVSGGTNREPRRRARLAAILRALGADVPGDVDADLPKKG